MAGGVHRYDAVTFSPTTSANLPSRIHLFPELRPPVHDSILPASTPPLHRLGQGHVRVEDLHDARKVSIQGTEGKIHHVVNQLRTQSTNSVGQIVEGDYR